MALLNEIIDMILSGLEKNQLKIIIINGSHRKSGATAQILNEMYLQLKKYNDADVQIVHAADLDLKYCQGCCSCYKTGKCIFADDAANLSSNIEAADGIIIGSPTYAGNVSGQLKTIIDRGHFVMEQLLYGKYAISVATYENYGGKDTVKILNRLLAYSGAKISGTIAAKTAFNSNPLENMKIKKAVHKKADRLHKDIIGRRKYIFQNIKHFIVFQIGIRPFVTKKGLQYSGVIRRWEGKR